jgi:hypothetical protein
VTLKQIDGRHFSAIAASSNHEMQRMNEDTSAAVIDRLALDRSIRQQGEAFYHSITERHAHLFAAVPVVITPEQLTQMQAVIAAVEEVVKLPGWIDETFSSNSAKGVFFGYDFHLNESGAHLIEINTNAGGAFLNALLLQSQSNILLPGKSTAINNLEQSLVDMFLAEWCFEHGNTPLGCVAIVDEKPSEQYLYPEFILAQQLFEQAGIRAVIADPLELVVRTEGVYLQDQKIDLIYNRLTDFSLENYPALLQAYRNNLVVLTPNPQAYTRYADKRNLTRLTDAVFLRSLNVEASKIAELGNGIPQTRIVNEEDAERWWGERKQWFFKPVTGYGAKGAYRGDKITKRVFGEILSGGYVAQKLAMPGECLMTLDGNESVLKYDARCYVYDGKIQLIAARLYQGQTTNFRTPGGGFALVRVL